MRNFLFLKKYKDQIEKEIEIFLESMVEKNKLSDACRYIISNGGKRFRPIIVMLLSEALGKNFDVIPSALSVEFFHTASLIADDLPCMDDELERRCKPALHLAFDESIALLASYTFISAGYEMLAINAERLVLQKKMEKEGANELCVLALKEISKVAGICGATNGQFLDLFPPDNSIETVFKIIKQKTVSLFEISFVLGWLFGGGKLEKLDLIKNCANHFGMAFQIADDINDFSQDGKNQCELNIVKVLGEKKAFNLFVNELNDFRKKMDQLNILTGPLLRICDLLESSVNIA